MALIKVKRKLRNEEDIVEVKEVTGTEPILVESPVEFGGNVEVDGNLTVNGQIIGEGSGEELTFSPSFTNTEGLISLKKYTTMNGSIKDLPFNGGYTRATINAYDFLCNVFIEFYNTKNLTDVITKGTQFFNFAFLGGIDVDKIDGQVCKLKLNGSDNEVKLFGTFPVKIMDVNSDNLYSATLILCAKTSYATEGFIYKIVFEEDIPAGTKMLFSQNITLRRATS